MLSCCLIWGGKGITGGAVLLKIRGRRMGVMSVVALSTFKRWIQFVYCRYNKMISLHNHPAIVPGTPSVTPILLSPRRYSFPSYHHPCRTETCWISGRRMTIAESANVVGSRGPKG